MPKKPKPGKKVAVSKEDLKKIIEKKKEIDERNKAYEDKKNELKQNKLKKKKAPVKEEVKKEAAPQKAPTDLDVIQKTMDGITAGMKVFNESFLMYWKGSETID